ncbi:MAG: hypothetical protein ACT4P2_14570 [Pseudomonadota bacterium]
MVMWHRVALVAGAAIALSLAAPGIARGHGSGLPAPDPPDTWRVMHWADEASTSKCVGKPSTPLCAVETFLACFVRKDDRLCRIGGGPHEPQRFYESRKTLISYWRYRVVSAKRLKAEEIPEEANESRGGVKRHERYTVRPGDTMLELRYVLCFIGADPCGSEDRRLYYFVRQFKDRWRVITAYGPREG